MSLLGTVTEENYYNGSQTFVVQESSLLSIFTLTFDPAPTASQIRVFVSGVETSNFTILNSGLTISQALSVGDVVEVKLLDKTFGNYQYTSIKDIVDNFMIAYVGDGKLIDHVAKSDIVFHAKRGLNPTEPLAQDENYNYVFDSAGNAVESSSVTEDRWKNFDVKNISGDISSEDSLYLSTNDYLRSDYGQRYGNTPETTQVNGFFTINERTGSFSFSSDLSGKLIVLEYISDGLGTDAEMKVNKMAEEALYKHIAYNVLATKRNASEIAQVMRNKSKRIKH